jgi:hypothetical protein
MIMKTAMLPIAMAGALAVTGAMAQNKQVDKTSQKFISSAIQGDIAKSTSASLHRKKV